MDRQTYRATENDETPKGSVTRREVLQSACQQLWPNKPNHFTNSLLSTPFWYNLWHCEHYHRQPFRAYAKKFYTTNSLTPWGRVLLNNIKLTQLVKKFIGLLWKPKVHYRVHKSPPLVPILSQIRVHTFSPYSLRSILILSSIYV
jgi:hypothetical protein